MSKRKDFLDEIRYKYIHLHNKSCEMFLRMLCDYYVKNDLETGNQLGKIFYALYMSDDNWSYDEIACEYHIGLSTLNRYRKRFNEMANKLLICERGPCR